MAAAVKFVTACETAFWPEGTFAEALAESAATAGADVLSNDRVAEAFEQFMGDKKEWKGAVTELLSELETIVRRPEREAELALALAKTEVRSRGKINDRYPTDSERAKEKAKEEEATRRVAEATANLKEARERVHTILGDRWPKAGNALSGRLKNLGPQLRGAGIHILWPTSHGSGKVLTVTNITLDLHKEKRTRETSSPSSHRPPPPGDGADKEHDINDLSQSDEVPWDEGERPPPDRPEDGPDSFDSDFMPAEPTQADLSGGTPRSTKSNGASVQGGPHSSGLRDKDQGYEI
jgi:hypothetical protein